MAPGTAAAASGFRFRALGKPEEFRAAEELQRQVLGGEGDVPAPTPVLRTWADHGGLVLGAFTDIYLAGIAVGFLGWDGAELYHYNQLTAVRPEYQNHHLGLRLGGFLREEVLRQGLPRARWTFDPLSSHGASLSIRRLGALPDKYLTHYYGQLATESDRGLETDRLRVRWELTDPRTEARLAGPPPASEELRRRWEGSAAIVETEVGDEGLRRPTTVAEPDRPQAHLEVPFDLAAVRSNAAPSLRVWRHAVRDAFRAGFDLGYRVDDFVVLNLEHERRSFYLLTRTPSSGDGTVPPAPSADK